MFHLFKKTFGLTLFRYSKTQIEIWYVLPSHTIPSHFHECIDSTIIHLFGSCIFWRNTDFLRLKIFSWRKIKIPRFVVHSAVAGKCGIIFINVEKVYDNSKLSAAQDLIVV